VEEAKGAWARGWSQCCYYNRKGLTVYIHPSTITKVTIIRNSSEEEETCTLRWRCRQFWQ